MKCFTVFETEVYPDIVVINEGIGINGQLASIANGVNFPKPEIGHSNENPIPPFATLPQQVMNRAAFFRHHGAISQLDFHPIIYNDDDDIYYQGCALALWIVGVDSPNRPAQICTHNAQDLLGPVTGFGYIQYLLRLFNGDSNVLCRTNGLPFINLSYRGGILSVTKQPL